MNNLKDMPVVGRLAGRKADKHRRQASAERKHQQHSEHRAPHAEQGHQVDEFA